MPDSDAESTPPAPSAPPTAPRPLAPPPPRWPTVIGVIAICYGALGAAVNGVGAVSVIMLGHFFGLAGTGEAVLQAMKDYRPWLLTQYGLAIALAILLIVVGTGVTRQGRWSVGIARIWGILKLAFVPGAGVVGLMVQRAQYAAMQHDPAFQSNPGAGALGSGFMDTMALLTQVVIVAWNCVLPIFVLVWFGRPRIKAAWAAWR